ncbi:hypothetical protein [Lentibacter sp.]|uniref:hypothetical protein n=1 Tax=Lentibacter sp. TaxID=2024994 RepID=UPI003F6A4455
MSDMPETGQFDYGARDPVTGERWVYVSREMAQAHPKGRLGAVLYAIVLYLVAVAGLRFYEFIQFGYAPLYLLLSVVPMLGALGLYFRVPFAIALIVLLFAISGYQLVTAIGSLSALGLVQLLASGAIAVYLVTSARANLIYRHRYRSFKGPE